jgi:hypothetical protein
LRITARVFRCAFVVNKWRVGQASALSLGREDLIRTISP